MKIRTVLSLMVAGACAMIANAEPFTYQGVLNQNGEPANGLYDINMRAFSSEIGGSALGSLLTFTNVDVVDGVFQVEVELGVVFDANDSWLSIAVRSAGAGIYTGLSPRTKFTATPKAQHATTATTADFALNAPWTAAPGIMTYGDGDDIVLINRSSTISGSEYFGVHGDTSGFAGMYVSGLENSTPFYGYSVAGRVDAYSFFRSTTDEWGVWKGGNKLIVDANGDVVASQVFKSDSFEFKTPQTRYTSVSGNVLSSGTGSYSVSAGNGGGYMFSTGSHVMTAPVSLPHGAVVTSMRVHFTDTVEADLTVSLSFTGHGSDFNFTISSLDTEGFSGPSLSAFGSTPNGSDAIIDHENRHYHLRVFSSNWPGDLSLRIKSVRISYRVTEAD